jgi:predicted transposase YbfD/YdcC
LEDILAITICAVICGAEGWNEIELFGQCKQPWLESFLELPNGIPSHDTFARVVSSIRPDDFENRFQKWIQALAQNTCEKIIAIDGKTLRRSFDIWSAHGHVRIKWSLVR